MPQPFDVRLDDLTGSLAESHGNAGAVPLPQAGERTFYIETFGCQMNAHDADKVPGPFLGRGYHQTQSLDAAKLVLFNTCSIREKPAQKFFSRLGTFRKHP